MVCVPCFIIPVLLFVWRILQPYIQRFWNPIDQNKEQATGGEATAATPGESNKETNSSLKLPFGITCPTCPMRGPCPNIENKSSEGQLSEKKVEKVD